MKQYVIDELQPRDYYRLKTYLDERFSPSGIEGIFWIPIDTDHLTHEQAEHTECHPLCFAVDLEPKRLACELLLRTRNRLRCSCIGYATEKQRNWVIRFVDTMLEELDIRT